MSGGSHLQQQIRDSIPDQGFQTDIDLMNLMRDEAALLITGSTSPVSVIASDYLMYRWAAANVDAMTCKVRLPRTLAMQPSKAAATLSIPFPRLKLHLDLRMGAAVGPDVPRVTVTAKARASGGALKATFTPTSIDTDGSVLTNGTCKPLANSTNPEDRTWNFFGVYGTGPVYLAPGDYLDIKIVPGAHGTDTVELHGAWLEVWSNAALTTRSLRS